MNDAQCSRRIFDLVGKLVHSGRWSPEEEDEFHWLSHKQAASRRAARPVNFCVHPHKGVQRMIGG
jgi:hypothetical protein